MTDLRLHNTQSGERETFTRTGTAPVTMWVCGPTVYDTPHIGNARPVIVFDLLFRLLKRATNGQVVYARNYTDVDDKIIARARERGISIAELCSTTISEYERVMSALGVEEPTLKPRATDNIPAMVAMIERLVERHHAYAVDDHVYFDTTSYPQGVLTGQTEGRDRARIEATEGKRHQSDFVLWKPRDGDVGWESPWGMGRPGWHIECSAMIADHLGTTIDIHGGGQDLIFPHHEAECAQSECAHSVAGRNDEGRAPLARYWVHNAMVLSDGAKMAKSDNNFITVADVIARYPGEALRFAMLHTHYRHPFDFRWDRVQEAMANLRRLMDRADSVAASSEPDEAFMDALHDDLNTPLAIARLHAMPVENIKASLAVMGFHGREADVMTPEQLEVFEERCLARVAGDWAQSDVLRAELLSLGIAVRDTPKGPVWEKVSGHVR